MRPRSTDDTETGTGRSIAESDIREFFDRGSGILQLQSDVRHEVEPDAADGDVTAAERGAEGEGARDDAIAHSPVGHGPEGLDTADGQF